MPLTCIIFSLLFSVQLGVGRYGKLPTRIDSLFTQVYFRLQEKQTANKPFQVLLVPTPETSCQACGSEVRYGWLDLPSIAEQSTSVYLIESENVIDPKKPKDSSIIAKIPFDVASKLQGFGATFYRGRLIHLERIGKVTEFAQAYRSIDSILFNTAQDTCVLGSPRARFKLPGNPPNALSLSACDVGNGLFDVRWKTQGSVYLLDTTGKVKNETTFPETHLGDTALVLPGDLFLLPDSSIICSYAMLTQPYDTTTYNSSSTAFRRSSYIVKRFDARGWNTLMMTNRAYAGTLHIDPSTQALWVANMEARRDDSMTFFRVGTIRFALAILLHRLA